MEILSNEIHTRIIVDRNYWTGQWPALQDITPLLELLDELQQNTIKTQNSPNHARIDIIGQIETLIMCEN